MLAEASDISRLCNNCVQCGCMHTNCMYLHLLYFLCMWLVCVRHFLTLFLMRLVYENDIHYQSAHVHTYACSRNYTAIHIIGILPSWQTPTGFCKRTFLFFDAASPTW